MKKYKVGLIFSTLTIFIGFLIFIIFVKSLFLLLILIPIAFLFLFLIRVWLDFARFERGEIKFSKIQMFIIILISLPSIIGPILLLVGYYEIHNLTNENKAKLVL